MIWLNWNLTITNSSLMLYPFYNINFLIMIIVSVFSYFDFWKYRFQFVLCTYINGIYECHFIFRNTKTTLLACASLRTRCPETTAAATWTSWVLSSARTRARITWRWSSTRTAGSPRSGAASTRCAISKGATRRRTSSWSPPWTPPITRARVRRPKNISARRSLGTSLNYTKSATSPGLGRTRPSRPSLGHHSTRTVTID